MYVLSEWNYEVLWLDHPKRKYYVTTITMTATMECVDGSGREMKIDHSLK